MSLKEQGNEAFKKKDYLKALEFYSLAIDKDPSNHVLHSNKSITLIHLERYKAALQSAEQCLSLNPKWAKGFYYKGTSLLNLNRFYDARKAFASAVDMEPNNTTFSKEFEAAESKYITQYYSPYTKNLPIEVQYFSRSKGKAVVSSKPFKFGETIFTEIPLVQHRFVSRSKHEEDMLVCDHCLRGFVTKDQLGQYGWCYEELYPSNPQMLPCPSCNVFYCSEKCKEKSWKSYHSVLCHGNSQELVKLEQLSRKLNRTNLLLVARIFGMTITRYRRFNDWTKAIEKFQAFLVSQEPNEGDEEAVVLLQRAICDDKLKPFISLANWRLFNGMIQRNAQKICPVSDFHEFLEKGSGSASKVLGNSSFFDWIQQPSNSSFLDSLVISGGTGLFRLGNSMNHSCSPNVVIISCFCDHTIKACALREIQKGEELCFSYIDESQPFDVRQKELKDKYLFVCQCSKCTLRQQ